MTQNKSIKAEPAAAKLAYRGCAIVRASRGTYSVVIDRNGQRVTSVRSIRIGKKVIDALYPEINQ